MDIGSDVIVYEKMTDMPMLEKIVVVEPHTIADVNLAFSHWKKKWESC